MLGMASVPPPGHDPLAREIVTAYTDAWGSLSPGLRAKLRAGVDHLDDADVAELVQRPRPLMTLSYWLSNPEGH